MSAWGCRRSLRLPGTKPFLSTRSRSGTTGGEFLSSFSSSSASPAFCCWSIRSEEHTSELQSLRHLVCRLLLLKKLLFRSHQNSPRLHSSHLGGACRGVYY